MSYNFNDKVVLVTGGNSGIGLACVKKFMDLGANVIATGRRAITELSRLTPEEISLLKKVDYRVCNVAEQDEQDKLFAHITSHYDKLNVAINNAGITGVQGKKISECSIDEYNEVMDINVRGVWLSMQHELRIMRKQQYGAIVNLSSVAGLKGSMVSALYAMSKFAVNGLTRTAALENANMGIRVNSVCPGAIETPIFETVGNELKQRLVNTIPMGRIGEPAETANYIAWLTSDEASFMTGTCVAVDGGVMA
ncbi:MAG: SDR family NAD(P)-dependent oxidoreductase [Gammaproteobacteria bacterium]